MICDECETVAHCLKNGCVPKQQPAPVQEPAMEYPDYVAGVGWRNATPPADEIQRLSALVRAQQITIDKLEALLKEKNCD